MALEDVLEFRFGKGVIGWSKVCVCSFLFQPRTLQKARCQANPSNAPRNPGKEVGQ